MSESTIKAAREFFNRECRMTDIASEVAPEWFAAFADEQTADLRNRIKKAKKLLTRMTYSCVHDDSERCPNAFDELHQALKELQEATKDE